MLWFIQACLSYIVSDAGMFMSSILRAPTLVKTPGSVGGELLVGSSSSAASGLVGEVEVVGLSIEVLTNGIWWHHGTTGRAHVRQPPCCLSMTCEVLLVPPTHSHHTTSQHTLALMVFNRWRICHIDTKPHRHRVSKLVWPLRMVGTCESHFRYMVTGQQHRICLILHHTLFSVTASHGGVLY